MADEQDNSTPTHGEPDPTSLPPLTTTPTTSPGMTEGVVDQPGDMDAANQSLADALGVSFRVLRWLMLVILVIFLLSGFFTVQADEVAVRTRFGKILPGSDGSEVLTADGGPYFRWPAPVGNVYRVSTSSRELRIDEAFVFEAAKGSNATTPLQELGLTQLQLDPVLDGSLLTADGSLVHARYSVTYRIRPSQAASFLANVVGATALTGAERNPQVVFADADALVRQAVEQAVVADAAQTTLDRFLGIGTTPLTAAPSPADGEPAIDAPDGADLEALPEDAADDAPTPDGGDPAEPDDEAGDPAADPAADTAPDAADAPATLADVTAGREEQDRVRAQAQQILDDLNSGIEIQAVTRTARDVPPPLRDAFDASTGEVVRKGLVIQQAQQRATSIYRTAAQRAYPAVLAVIEIYEEAELLKEQEPERFETAQRAIDGMFDGEPLEGPLETAMSVLAEDDPRRAELTRLIQVYGGDVIGGTAGTIVSRAQNRATRYIQQLQADASVFESQLAQYRQNPDAVRQKLYLEMISEVLSNPDTVKDTVSSNSEVVRLLLNEDLSIARRIERRQREERSNRGAPRPAQQQR